jgi:hypothetical protein
VSNKQKNNRHKESVARKIVAEKEVAHIGLRLTDNIRAIGLVFSHLEVSHLTYLGLSSINEFCKKYAGVDICLFSQHNIIPCLTPLCPVFNISNLARWHNEPIITTSIGTTIEALSSNVPIIYYYAFDPEFIDKSHLKSTDLVPAFTDSRVKVIVRHESHKRLIEEEFGIQICDTIVEDCDMEKLAKLVLGDTHE